jgi:hypothetical protein
MMSHLRPYTVDDLKFLPYKQEIEAHYRHILDQATEGQLITHIHVNPNRNRVVIKNLQELFPDTLFIHTRISELRDTYGYVVYKASWVKKKAYTEVYPFRTSSGTKVVRF